MATQTGLTIIKRFSYRGNNEDYSNTYWLTGTPPASSSAWRTLFDAMVATEKTCYASNVSVIGGYGYDDNTGHKSGDTGTVASAVYNVDLTVSPEVTVPGTMVTTGGVLTPGDNAVWCRWKTSRVSSPGGKPVYLRKYFHLAYTATGGGDAILAGQKTALLAHAVKLSDGSFSGARLVTAAGHTDTIIGTGASSYVTTRTLKRRGKRPGGA